MESKKNKVKGWLISLLVLLVLFKNIPNVKALENDYLDESNLTVIEEEITNRDGTQEEALEEDVIEDKTKEEIFTTYSMNLEFKNNEVIVKGNINELITVGELLDNIDIEELINNYSIEKITVTNEEDVLLVRDDYITNKCHLIIISNEYIANYKISFLGDLNQDSLVNDKDIETGIEDFFEEEIEEDIILDESLKIEENKEVFFESTKEEIVIIEDKTITEEVSYVDAVIKNNSYDVDTPILEEKVNVILDTIDKDEFYVGSSIVLELSMDGLNDNYVNTISGNIEYNIEILELENIYITVDNRVVGKYVNNKFIYVLDNFYGSKPLILIIFKSIKEGSSSISITDLKVSMNGTLININNNTNLNITILEAGKGGDVETETPPIINIPELIPSKPITKPITNTTNNPTKLTQTTINEITKLSNDNYIKNIEIDNYEINFNKDKNYYSINVDNNTNYLDLNIVLNSEFATYEIIGNENFIPGKNEIIITVTSQNNEARDYIIEVNKEDNNIKEELNLEDKNNKIIHIITLVVLIIIIIILIYKLLIKED